MRSMRQDGKLEAKYEETTKTIERSFEKNYQKWYTESHAVIKQLLPDRLNEFVELYRPEPRRKEGRRGDVSDSGLAHRKPIRKDQLRSALLQ